MLGKNRGRNNVQSKIIGSILLSLHKLRVLYISELWLQIVHQVGCKQIFITPAVLKPHKCHGQVSPHATGTCLH